MIRFLNIKTIPFVLTETSDFEKIILVDCFPGRGNVSLPTTTPVHAVIDHHPNNSLPGAHFFSDIRKEFGATSTIITKYLLHAGCQIDPKLATALFYGIKTDTGDMRREGSPVDLECYKFLFDIMDHQLLSRIENPDRDVEYFKILHRASEYAVTFDSVGYTHLGNVTTPDYVAEMADLFHSLEKLEWMVCSGIFKNQIFFSIRSKNSDKAGISAEKIASILHGSGGGHSRVAAGKVPLESDSGNIDIEKFELTIKVVLDIPPDVRAEKLLKRKNSKPGARHVGLYRKSQRSITFIPEMWEKLKHRMDLVRLGILPVVTHCGSPLNSMKTADFRHKIQDLRLWKRHCVCVCSD